MKTSDVRKLSPYERLEYWIRERESIRVKRTLKLPPPWTDDEILQSYRFCNVRRMDDRVSQWLLTYWYARYKNHPNSLVAATLARHFNLPAVLLKLTALVYCPGEPRWELVKEVVREMKRRGGEDL